jgi:hypothetical protein
MLPASKTIVKDTPIGKPIIIEQG